MKLLKKTLFYGGLVVFWAWASHSGLWPRTLFPSPLDVGGAIVAGVRDQTLGFALLSSAQRILFGYALSVVAGALLGVIVAQVRLLDENVSPLIVALYSLPGITWLPIATLWFGPTEAAIQFVIVTGGMLAVTWSTIQGIRNLPPIFLRAARTMGVRGFDLHWRVVVPAALPSVVVGMKLGWAFAWRGLMAGELILASPGLGHLLKQANQNHDLSRIVAVMLIIMVSGILVDQLVFTPLEKRVEQLWGYGAAGTR